MSSVPTLEDVQAIVVRVAGRSPRDVGPDTPLTDGGFGLDSIRLLRAILACEQTFAIAFDPDTDFTADSLRTVGTLFALVRSKRRP